MFLVFCCVFVVWTSHSYVGAECPKIIGKKEWDGAAAKHVTYLTTPVDLVVIEHTVTQTCTDDVSCAEVVRNLQKIHQNEAFLWDITPAFLIASTGKIYEGRGWIRVAVHTSGFNNHSIGISFIGNFNNHDPSPKALEACKALIQCGVETGRLTSDHKVVGHSQLISTESPGKKLFKKIMSWSDWVKDVTDIKKLVDTLGPDAQEQKEKGIEGRSTIDNKNEILKSPEKIDSLSNLRAVIAELIRNLRDLAQQTIKTSESFTKTLTSASEAFYDTLASTLGGLRDRFNEAISSIGSGKCSDELKKEANSLYDNADADTRACADKRIMEVNEMIQNLGELSSKAIDYSNVAVENTRNCTELNYGIESNTASCLNSVTTQTKSASNTFDSQRTLALKSIETSLKSLPSALQLCGKQPIAEATTGTGKITASFPKCALSVLPNFSFGRR